MYTLSPIEYSEYILNSSTIKYICPFDKELGTLSSKRQIDDYYAIPALFSYCTFGGGIFAFLDDSLPMYGLKSS